MRCVVAGTLLVTLACPALAADPAIDVLRGSVIEPIAPNPVIAPITSDHPNWTGFYVGGQIGYIGSGSDFGNSAQPLIANMLRNSRIEDEGHVSTWSPGGRGDTNAQGYGGFIGYNSQWDDVVLGLEANYTRTSIKNGNIGSIERLVTLSDNYTYDVTLLSGSSIEITDILTLRGRAGYAFGQFLPYVTAGLALGRANYTTAANVSYPIPVAGPGAVAPVPPAIDVSDSEGKTNALIYGYALGTGIDVTLLPNVFLRAEYEYIQFSQFKTSINNARVGVAVKF